MKNMVKTSMTKNIIFLFLALWFVPNGMADVQAGSDQTNLINYCSGKIDAGLNLIHTRGEWTVKEIIEKLDNSRDINNAPHYIYIDWIRMVRTINRHPDMTDRAFEQRFYGECMAFGF